MILPLLVALAGSATAAETIDLPTALAIALRDGVDAREAALAERAAEAALASRRTAGLPDLRLGASTGVSAGSSGTATSGRLSLSSVTPLYAGGSIRSERDAAEAAVGAARADAEAVRQDLHLALAGALLDVAARDALAASAEASLEAERRLAERVEALVAAGARTRADSLQTAASVARVRALVATTSRDAQQAGLALRRLLRLDPSVPLSFRAPAAPEPLGDTSALIELARERRPELIALRAELDAAEADARGARAGGLPSLDLVLGADTALSGEGAAVVDQLRDESGATAGLQLAVPLYDRGVTRGRVAAAQVSLSLAELAVRTAEADVAYDVRGAVLDTEAAAVSAAAAQEREAAAQAAAEVVEERYAAGAATLAELQSVRAEAIAARAAGVSAEAEQVAARFRLARAIGGL
jgi:outer membrane protein